MSIMNRLSRIEEPALTEALRELCAALLPLRLEAAADLDAANARIYGGLAEEERAAAMARDERNAVWLIALDQWAEGRCSAQDAAGAIVTRFGGMWPAGTPALTLIGELVEIVWIEVNDESPE